MHTAVRVDNITELANLQGIGRVLEGRLHFAAPKFAEVAAVLGRTAVALTLGQVGKLDFSFDDLLAEILQQGNGLLLGALGDDGALGVLPGRRSARSGVLHL